MEESAALSREEYREYLEKTGIITHLTRILVDLYEEQDRPEDPLDYIRVFLGVPREVNIEAVQAENEELRFRCEELEATIDALMNQLEEMRNEREEDN